MSGVVDRSGRHGVAIAPSEADQAALSPCIASARMKGAIMDLNLVVDQHLCWTAHQDKGRGRR